MRARIATCSLLLLGACGGDSAVVAETTSAPTTVTAVTIVPATTTTTTVTSTSTSTSSALDLTRWDVASITDGDTFDVVTPAGIRSVRLIGINAPEGGECLARDAEDALRALIAGSRVVMESDVSDVDTFDRWLRYVYVDGVLVNEALVERGMAVANRYEPDTALADVLEAAQVRAQQAAVGMWAPDACGAVSAAPTVAIGTIRYDAPGNDNQNLNEEWIELVNHGSSVAELSGWGIKDESASHRYAFPDGFVVPAGSSLILHTGCGDDTAADLYWCNTGSAVWNNDGDTVFLLDSSGNVVETKSY